ncbi:MAG: hypothetical protein AAF919_01570 [Pseudomonadota bacterium]
MSAPPTGPWTPKDATGIPRVPLRPRDGVAVWLLHPGAAPDYYETVFDFAAFVEASRTGVPHLVVWTGRDDLDRAGLRGTIRRIVSAEIDAARAQLAAGAVDPGAVQDQRAMAFVLTLAAQGALLATRATPVGLALSALIGAAGLVLARDSDAGTSGPEAGAKLEAEIARVRAATDAALARMELRLHPDLAKGRGDPEAWPIPAAVQALMGDRR